jgi:two-component system sensor histidine kinase/response regulator
MSEPKTNAADWRERCHAALDTMRDDPERARRIAYAILDELPPRPLAEMPQRLSRQQPLLYLQDLALPEQRKYLGGELILAFCDYFEGDCARAEREFARLEELLQIVNDLRSVALCMYGRISVWRTLGRTREAYEYGYAHALPIVAHFQTPEKVAVLNAMGVVAQEYDRTEEAIRHFYGALELARKLELESRVAQITANIGEILYMCGNSEDAEAMLEEASALAARSGERWLAPFVGSLLALCRISMGKYAQAHAAIEHFLTGIGNIGTNLANRGFCLSIAAYTLSMRGEIDEAERLVDAAVSLLDHYEDKQEKPYTWWVRGHLHHRRGRLPEAIAALRTAVDMNGELGFYFMPQRALHELAEIYEEMGDWQAAFHEHRRYHELFVRAQSYATRARLQLLHIQGELREAERARRSAEANMAERDTILDNSMVGIVFLNDKGAVQWSNRAMSDMLGAAHGDNVGHSFEQYFPSRAEYRKLVTAVRRTVSGKTSFEIECRMHRRDGTPIWAWISGRAVDPADPSRGTVWVALDISMRRRLEEDLHKSEEKLRQVIDNVTEGITVVQNGLIRFANPRLCQLTGNEHDQVIGQPFLPFVHPEDRERVGVQHLRRMRGETVDQYYTFRVLNSATGDYRWIENSGVLIQWEGHPATLAFISDITERKRLEQSVSDSLLEREIILENSMVGIAFLDPKGRVRWSNRTLNEMLGDRHGDSQGLSLEPFYPSREEYLATGGAAAVAIAEGKPFEAELRLLRNDGTLFWAWISGRSVNRNDLEQGTVWVVVDIDKRRRLEIDLQKSEEHHRQVVDNATEGILVLQDDRVVFANQRVAQIRGRTLDEVFALSANIDIHPDDLAHVHEEIARCFSGLASNKHHAFRMVQHDTGAIRWVECSAVVIEWEGAPAGLAFLTDITERRALEQSLEESRAERIRLQTLQFETELKEAEMARRHAEETTRAKSMFLANMSHEIRTPMNAIIGMAHLALRSQLDPKQRDYVEKIHGAGISLLGIINDILDFSKIEAGKMALEQVDFNLDTVLANVSMLTSGKAQEKRLEYLFQLPNEIPRNLIGDPLRLGQVLINLINNAIKFTEHGEVTVACRTRLRGEGEIELEFVVGDTGIGMTTEQVARLFRAFSQADETTTRKYGGTGLGLSIALGMVQMMGGRIWIESEAGRGTRAHFTARFGLPLIQPRRHVLPDELNGLRLLAVDDNDAARAVLADILGALPVTVEFAAGGEQALAMLRAADHAQPYDVVLTDLDMPVMDGIALISEVKRDGVLRKPPRMVLISAHGNESVRYRSESSLADGFLLKPVNASVLIDALVRLFAPAAGCGQVRWHEAVPHFHGLSVLLVEDNQINQQIAAELMQAAGIVVEVAANGRLAVERLREAGPAHFGMVFMDVQMPEMDGHQATRTIRADPAFADLPIVAMTAHAMEQERESCIASGMNDHIAKPIDPETVYQAIARWCPLQLEAGARDAARVASFMEQFDAETGFEAEPAAPGDAPTLIIPGFDVADGLLRTLGNQEFYLQLLGRFRDGQADAAERIRAALVANDFDTGERLSHTLKGVAGMLGARQLAQLAGRMETLFRAREAEEAVLPLLDQLELDLTAAILALDAVLPATAAPAAGNKADAADLPALLRTLAALLAQSDGDAIDLLNESAALLRSGLGPRVQQEVAAAAAAFDFDAALAALLVGARAAGHALPQPA